jgi:hypothetical protein
MARDVSFFLLGETRTKDATGQTVTTKTETEVIGIQDSTYQNEFFQASQAGLRPQGSIKMNRADYSGEKFLGFKDANLNLTVYSIYRTFEPDDDWIELYYGSRVGNG